MWESRSGAYIFENEQLEWLYSSISMSSPDMDSTLEILLKLVFFCSIRSGQRPGRLWLILQYYSADTSGRSQRRYGGWKQHSHRQSRPSRQKHTLHALLSAAQIWTAYKSSSLTPWPAEPGQFISVTGCVGHWSSLLCRESVAYIQRDAGEPTALPGNTQVTPLILQRCCVCKSDTARDHWPHQTHLKPAFIPLQTALTQLYGTRPSEKIQFSVTEILRLILFSLYILYFK